MVASTQSRRKVRFICVFALGAPIVAIGGAGTFDGVFLTGIPAGLLAAWKRSARPLSRWARRRSTRRWRGGFQGAVVATFQRLVRMAVFGARGGSWKRIRGGRRIARR